MQVVKKNFFESSTFKRRQNFVFMCGEAMNRKELFEQYFKYELLSIVGDRVPNVRMCLSRVLRAHFTQVNGAFVFDEDVNEAVRLLKRDKSADVREAVADIQTFPLNGPPSSDDEVSNFVKKMREQISSRVSSSASTVATSEVDVEASSRISWISQSAAATAVEEPTHQEPVAAVAEDSSPVVEVAEVSPIVASPDAEDKPEEGGASQEDAEDVKQVEENQE